MAFAALNPARNIWQGLGLKYLLFPEDVKNGAGFCFKAESAPKPVKPRPVPPGPAPVKPRGMPEKNASTPVWHLKPVDEWPEIWQKQFARARKAQFAWTWWDLGLDLLAAQSPRFASCGNDAERKERSLLLKKLLAELAHPPGSHTFWPVCMPCGDGNPLTPDFDCFWSGIQLLQCRGVILLGSPAARAAMAADDLKPLTQLRKFGKFVWILWDPNVIASRPRVYDRVLGWLRISLRPFIRF